MPVLAVVVSALQPASLYRVVSSGTNVNIGSSVSFRLNVAESAAEQPLLSVTVTFTAYSRPQSGLTPVTVVEDAFTSLASLPQT